MHDKFRVVCAFALTLGVLAGDLHGQLTKSSETGASDQVAKLYRLIDKIAAHPFDPDKPSDMDGRSDDEVRKLDSTLVDRLLSKKSIDEARRSPDPRHLFGLARISALHKRDEPFAGDLFDEAARRDSAPAAYYLSFYYRDTDEDLVLARDWLGVSIQLGFDPADTEWDAVVGEMEKRGLFDPAPVDPSGDDGDAATELTSGTPQLDPDQYHQPALLRAMLAQQNSELDRKFIISGSAPDFLVAASKNPEHADVVNRVLAKQYLAQLVLGLQEKALGEEPAYLPVEIPKLTEFVDANVAGSARLSLQSEEVMIFRKVLGVIVTVAKFKPVVDVIEAIRREGDLNQASVKNAIEAGARGWVENDTRAKALKLYEQTIQEQGKLDAIRLTDLYYKGNPDVVKVYSGLTSVFGR